MWWPFAADRHAELLQERGAGEAVNMLSHHTDRQNREGSVQVYVQTLSSMLHVPGYSGNSLTHSQSGILSWILDSWLAVGDCSADSVGFQPDFHKKSLLTF